MKVALVCDDLVQYGGHEKVILDICKLFPEATLYTTMATKEWEVKCRNNDIKLKTSFMQKFPFKKKLNRIYAPFLFYVVALESFDFNDYDVVISMSSRFAHGVLTKPQTLHICYMSTVGRMIWEPSSYFEDESFGGIRLLKRLGKAFLSIPLLHLRIWDQTASKRPDYFIVNSKTTQNRLKKYYERDSKIIHPSVDVSRFSKTKYSKKSFKSGSNEKYFFIISRLAPWKKVDLAVRACGDLGLNLKIAGTGSHKDYLKKISLEYSDDCDIEFLGYISEEDKIKHFTECEALIITQFEDFGITPLEAMSCGTPVIAFKKGGPTETVIDGKTGTFFRKQEVGSLKRVLDEFENGKFNREEIIKHAQNFDIQEFNSRITNFVKNKYNQKRNQQFK